MTFLSPILLSGLLLASVPIIIHLLNRRRFVRIDWAPMEYLKLTLRKNRKRIQIEQLLLLAVRVLAILALFFAVARPSISNSGLAQILAAQGRAARFLVIDDSLSMGTVVAGKSAFSRAKEAAVELFKHVQPQDTVTILTSTQPETPLVRNAHLEETESHGLVEGLELTHAFGQWATTLEKADVHVQGSSQPVREVILVTDLRAAGWDGGVADVVDRWAAGNVLLRVIDVGRNVGGNVVLKSLEQTAPIALVHTPVGFLAHIRNDAGEPAPSQDATLTVDGKPQSILLPEVPAAGEIELPVNVTFDTAGMHGVELSLPRDGLPEDGLRYASLDVRNTLAIQVVDGEPDPRPFESETDFLELAYSVGKAPWQTTRMTDSQWAANPLVAPDVLVLANVGAVTDQRAAELYAQVEAGLGVMIFLGEQVDPTTYNRVLFREGRGILPAEISRFREEEVVGLVLDNFADSPLAPLAKIKSEALAKIRPRRFAEVAVPAEAGNGVRVLARWNDSRQSPAIIEKRIGEGRVLLWTMTADKKWSDWPTDGSYVLAVRQAAMAVASHGVDRDNIAAGQPLRYRLDKHAVPNQASAISPGKAEPEFVAIDRSDAKFPQLRYDKTLRAGFYRLQWKDPLMGETTHLFAVSPDIRESNLAPVRNEDLKNLLGKLNPTVIHFGESKASASAAGTELWRTAIWGLLGLVVVESCLAAWIGRESR